jgi:hypothetical protein
VGDGAKANLFGQQDPLGQFVKVNDEWFHVIGVVAPQLTAQSPPAGLPAQDLNNLIYVPLFTALDRLEDTYSDLKDDSFTRIQLGCLNSNTRDKFEWCKRFDHFEASLWRRRDTVRGSSVQIDR